MRKYLSPGRLAHTALVLLIIFTPSFHTSAKSVTSTSLFVITQNLAAMSSSLWRVELSSRQAQALVTPQTVGQRLPASSPLSEAERAALRHYNATGGALDETSVPFTQTVRQVWGLDASRILVESTNDVCEPMVRYPNGCFGYYELFIMDSSGVNKVRSVWKLDYHGEGFAKLGCTLTNLPILFNVVLNPKEDKLAITLGATYECGTKAVATHVMIIDYSKPALGVVDIADARGISWSPDGTHIAYYQFDECTNSECLISVRVGSSLNEGAAPITAEYAKIGLPDFFQLPTAWANNSTVVYKWVGSTSIGEVYPTLVWHDVTTHVERQTTPADLESYSALFYLKPNVVATENGNSIRALALPQSETLAVAETFNDVQQVVRNVRFPDVFLKVDLNAGCQGQIAIINVDGSSAQTINLGEILPKDECAIYVSP